MILFNPKRRDAAAIVAALATTTIAGRTVGTHAATPGKTSSRLSVHIPQSLSKEGGYDHRESLFGIPPYGGSISQNVYYADSDLCDANVDNHKGYPERPLDENGKMEPWPAPFILMADRGSCTFVRKVRNAQRAGAAAVIIADNTCLCSDQDCVNSSSGSPECEAQEPIMADDGSGSDISIPSFLLFKQDADIVKAELLANHMVQIEMAWSLPSPDDRVEYDLWTVPTDMVSRDFLKNFKDVAVALGDRAYFTPHMYIYDGVKSSCQGDDGESMCYNLCTNHGRYCATDPDNDLDVGISGADVVTESLRRLCIWKHYGEASGIGEPWWDYVATFTDKCDSPDLFSDEKCIRGAYNQSGIDGNKIEQCMKDSGGLDDDKQNTFLELSINAQNARGVVVIPTAFVNMVPIRGALTTDTVFKAVCAGFAEGTAPDVCSKCSRSYNVRDCIIAPAGASTAATESVPSSPTATKSVTNLYEKSSFVTGAFNDDFAVLAGAKVIAGLDACGIDISAVQGAFDDDGGNTDAAGNGLDLLHEITGSTSQCSNEMESNFMGAFQAFDTCTGWDSVEFIESFPSMLFGAGMRCLGLLNVIAGEKWDDDNVDLSAVKNTEEYGKCVNAYFGDNALGKVFREMYQFPDQKCPCFEALHDSVPECHVDEWPIPLSGSMIKTGACIVGIGCSLVDAVCEAELKNLDECLPPSDSEEACETVVQSCRDVGLTLVEMPTPMAGAPLPDACGRVYYQKQGLQNKNILERYERFNARCNDGKDDIWRMDGQSQITDHDHVAVSSKESASHDEPKSFPVGFLAGFAIGVCLCASAFVASRGRRLPATRLGAEPAGPANLDSGKSARYAPVDTATMA